MVRSRRSRTFRISPKTTTIIMQAIIKNLPSKEKDSSPLKISPKPPPHHRDYSSNRIFKVNVHGRKVIIQRNKKRKNQTIYKSLRNMNRLFNNIKSIQHISRRIYVLVLGSLANRLSRFRKRIELMSRKHNDREKNYSLLAILFPQTESAPPSRQDNITTISPPSSKTSSPQSHRSSHWNTTSGNNSKNKTNN